MQISHAHALARRVYWRSSAAATLRAIRAPFDHDAVVLRAWPEVRRKALPGLDHPAHGGHNSAQADAAPGKACALLDVQVQCLRELPRQSHLLRQQ